LEGVDEKKRSCKEASFIIKDADLEVVSFNYDVDSVTFTYETSVTDAATFWTEISNRSEESRWKVLDGEGNIRRYERLLPPREGSMGYYSAEDLRIAYDPKAARVIVAWVQSDSSKPIDRFEETNHTEVHYARETVWPGFEEQIEAWSLTADD
jgi:hypothetical protein